MILMDPLDDFIKAARSATELDEILKLLRAVASSGLARAIESRPKPWFWLLDADLTIFATSGQPGTGSAPHDHGLDAVISCLIGWEGSRNYELVGQDLIETSRSILRAGEVHTVPSGSVHAVFNCWTEPNIVLHVYAGDFSRAPKQVWDPITGTASTLGPGEPLAPPQ